MTDCSAWHALVPAALPAAPGIIHQVLSMLLARLCALPPTAVEAQRTQPGLQDAEQLVDATA